MRTATQQDFQVGATFQDKHEGWEFTLIEKQSHGAWVARFARGESVVFEHEAACNWLVKSGAAS